jgi:hypothetical protein
MARESGDRALVRWAEIEELQTEYKDFLPFLWDVMELLGFSVTEIQADIAHFLQHGPQYRMIQAQRGQAKSTITAAYAVWRLIHNPRLRVLILSAGGTQANEVATLCIRIIESMEVLECMRADKNAGDRSSTEAYDIHHSLKGVDKSPSIACVGITGNVQGKRADLLIADDIESSKNSLTATQRESLLHLTRDFTSICSSGDIIYLGTPQSAESIYLTLPARGFCIRIWPGRYPTADQVKKYGNMLAPLIVSRIARDASLQRGGGITGEDGQPIDAKLLDEQALVKKEIDQTRAYFMLQHMLLTDLSDEERYPLKLKNLVFCELNADKAPLEVTWLPRQDLLLPAPLNSSAHGKELYRAAQISEMMLPYATKIMVVDPAGGGINGDENGYCVLGFLHGNLYVLDAGGVKGGWDAEQMKALAKIALKWGVNHIIPEKNYGNGAFTHIFVPYMRDLYEKEGLKTPGVDEVHSVGRKEARICDTLEPMLGRHRIIMNIDIITSDSRSTEHAAIAKRKVYQLLHQLAFITRDPDSLVHDDRVDALAIAVAYFADRMAQESKKKAEDLQTEEILKWMNDPLGKGMNLLHKPTGAQRSHTINFRSKHGPRSR